MRILDPASYDEMWTPLAETWFRIEVNRHYGLGWTMGDYDEIRVISHAGLDPGFNAVFRMVPEQSSAFLITCNYTGFDEGTFPAFILRDQILNALLGITR